MKSVTCIKILMVHFVFHRQLVTWMIFVFPISVWWFSHIINISSFSLRGTRRPGGSLVLLWDHRLRVGREVLARRQVPAHEGLPHGQGECGVKHQSTKSICYFGSWASSFFAYFGLNFSPIVDVSSIALRLVRFWNGNWFEIDVF